MSYTPPYSDFVANLASTHYGLLHLGLASASYTYEAFPMAIAEEFATFIPTLPAIPDISAAGYWSLDWGPALCTNTGGLFNDNLVAILSYRIGTSPSGTPAFFAVICRGTDVGGDIAQISEDLNAFVQQPWTDVLNGTLTFGGATVQTVITNPTGSGVVAAGSADALIAVSNLVPYTTFVNQGTPTYLGPTLVGLLGTFPGTPVVVTGHSLGGALTQVVATYLRDLFKQTGGEVATSEVIAQAFAPPTVGTRSSPASTAPSSEARASSGSTTSI